MSDDPGRALARELLELVESGVARLRALTARATAERPAPGEHHLARL